MLADTNPDCDGGRAYTAGTVVRLRARARGRSAFAGWSGDVDPDGKVVIDRHKSVIANFIAANDVCYPLTVTITPPSAGSVALIPPFNCNGGFAPGTEVLFEATPAAGYAFGGWGGDFFGPDPAGSIEMDGAKKITAIFAQPAKNDEIANAMQLTLPATVLIDTSNASNSPDDPDMCEAGKSGKTLWFIVTPRDDGVLRLDTNGSNYHTVMQLYSGGPRSLAPLVCSAEALPGTVVSELSSDFDLASDELAGLQVAVKKGVTYYIEVGDATEPEMEQADFNFTDDFKDLPDGGLLQLNAVFTAAGRGRAVRH